MLGVCFVIRLLSGINVFLGLYWFMKLWMWLEFMMLGMLLEVSIRFSVLVWLVFLLVCMLVLMVLLIRWMFVSLCVICLIG